MARKVVYAIYEEPISAKTPENPPHYHCPFKDLVSVVCFFDLFIVKTVRRLVTLVLL
jgi:hypothetical protein